MNSDNDPEKRAMHRSLSPTESANAQPFFIDSDRALLSGLMDASPDRIYLKDRNSGFVRMNRAMAESFGLPSAEAAVGKTDFDFFGHEHSRKAFEDEQRIMATGKTIAGVVEKEDWKDGRITWVSSTKIPWRDASGEIVGIIGISRDMTERKRAEEALAESEKRFHSLFNSMAEGVAIHQLIYDSEGKPVDHRIVAVNPAYEKHTGIPIAQAENRLASELYGMQPPPNLELFAEIAHGGEPRSFEYCYSPLQIHFAVSASSPKAGWFVTVFSNITERKKRETEIRHLTRLYAVLSRVNQAVIRIHSRQELFQEVCAITTECGEFRLAWFGCANTETGEVIPMVSAGAAQEYLDHVHIRCDDKPEGKGPAGTCLREGRPCLINDFSTDPITVPWREIAEKYGLRSVMALPIERREADRVVLIVYAGEKDFFQTREVELLGEVASGISHALDHLDQEYRRRLAEKAQAQSVSLLRATLESTADGILVVDLFGRIVDYNTRFAQLWRLPVETLLLKDDDAALTIMGDQIAEPEEFIERVHTIYWSSEEESFDVLRFKDARIYERYSRPQRVDGKAVGRVWSFIDITERKQMEENFLRSQRMECIGSLAGGLAHDLNNLLAPIVMSASLLRLNLAHTPHSELLATIEEAAQRAGDMVKQVLTFARGVEGQRIVLEPKTLIGQVARIVRETFPKSITLSFELPENLWNVTGDLTQLHQVLLNLCVNARDAMANGGTLTLSAMNCEFDEEALTPLADGVKPGRFVEINVTDSGSGIPKEIIDKIFEPFFTTKETGKGTGLGLSTVIGIVRSHGGWVMVQSEEGVGTTFQVFVPATEAAVTASSTLPHSPVAGGNGEMILIVDDEPQIVKTVGSALTRYGYVVLAASSGIDALALYKEHAKSVQAVLTDIVMPDMGGVELIRELRRLSPKLPVVAASGHAEESHQNDLKELGISVVLKKPFTIGRLLNKIHQAIHGEL